MYLLDSPVVAELRKVGSVHANAGVIDWATSVPYTAMYLSVVTMLELKRDILLKEPSHYAQAQHLREWLDTQVWEAFDNRIVLIDLRVVELCATLPMPHPEAERDALIAASALAYHMTLVSCNVEVFETTEVRLLNPWHG